MYDRRRITILEQHPDPAAVLLRLRLRETDYVRFDSVDLLSVSHIIQVLSPEQCLVVSAAAGPLLWQALVQRLGEDSRALCKMLSGPFLPALALPTLGEHWIERVRPLAQGQPGDPVAHGLFPCRLTKLARLLLAHAGAYPEATIWHAAQEAYHRSRPYHAHDALACAVVDRRVDAGPLLRTYLGHTAQQRGWRSRHKTWTLARWAKQHGYLYNTSESKETPQAERLDHE